jgi:hypothetical protein
LEAQILLKEETDVLFLVFFLFIGNLKERKKRK